MWPLIADKTAEHDRDLRMHIWPHTTKWSRTPLILIVVLLKRTAQCTFCKFLEALNVGLVEWK